MLQDSRGTIDFLTCQRASWHCPLGLEELNFVSFWVAITWTLRQESALRVLLFISPMEGFRCSIQRDLYHPRLTLYLVLIKVIEKGQVVLIDLSWLLRRSHRSSMLILRLSASIAVPVVVPRTIVIKLAVRHH